jgi:hypothetical protein
VHRRGSLCDRPAKWAQQCRYQRLADLVLLRLTHYSPDGREEEGSASWDRPAISGRLLFLPTSQGHYARLVLLSRTRPGRWRPSLELRALDRPLALRLDAAVTEQLSIVRAPPTCISTERGAVNEGL